ncbi:MAG: diaminopimelate epimerase [Clostridia bacterium]|nr:diaminopimelate epimerase [Clostridia bacterium]
MRFTKMQALGNDYLYIFDEPPSDVAELAVKLSDRRFGVGADGLIYILPSAVADYGMRIFNADGSEGMMCGNGIRCVGKYLYDKGYTDKAFLRIETASGIRMLHLHTAGGKVREVTVDMGDAEVSEDRRLTVSAGTFLLTPVSVGNPHAVIFVPDNGTPDVERFGGEISAHPSFPGGVNVEAAKVLSENSIRMRVWERGSGVTAACGTGACAAAAAAVSKGLCRADAPLSVILDGGALEIIVSKDLRVTMTGGAETVYEGEIALC